MLFRCRSEAAPRFGGCSETVPRPAAGDVRACVMMMMVMVMMRRGRRAKDDSDDVDNDDDEAAETVHGWQ